jgi:hypothetical protein
MTTIAQDYDSSRVNRLVQANFPVCTKSLYDDFNKSYGTNKPTGFVVSPNLLKIEKPRFKRAGPCDKCTRHKIHNHQHHHHIDHMYSFMVHLMIALLIAFLYFKL